MIVIDNENDEPVLLKNIERIEELIIETIYSIRKSCSRPSYSSVLSHINGGEEFNLNAESLKRIVKDMVDKGTIYIKGKRGSESFYVVEEEETDKEVPGNNNNIDPENILKNILSGDFYHVFVNKLKDDVMLHITEETLLSTKLDDKFKSLSVKLDEKFKSLNIKADFNAEPNPNDITHNKNDKNDDRNKRINGKVCTNDVLYDGINSDRNSIAKDDILITSLKEEIAFLRNEIRSKDKIIELIITELPNGYERNVKPNKESEFKLSSKGIKNNKGSLQDTLQLSNKFSPLKINNDKDGVIKVSDNGKSKDKHAAVTSKKKRTINFIGDSLLKDVKPYELKHKMKKTDKLYVQSYKGARTSAMKHHANASLEFDPDVYAVHIGTNDLKLEKSPSEIANNILEIGLQLMNDHNKVFISSIVTRRDDSNEKGKKVNDFLKLRCPNYLLGYIDNSNITNRHLNQSGLHLNREGSKLLSDNFLRVINN